MKRLINTLSKAGLNGFFFCLLGAVELASQFPHLGAENSMIPFSKIATYGVAVIFFFYGLKLSPQKMKEGLFNWRLHVLIQSTTFIIFPIVVLTLQYFFTVGQEAFSVLWLGIFYVAALPSTVSSSVVMVSIAEGNIPAAIFNASISSILGVFITPIWITLLIGSGFCQIDTSDVIIKLCIQVIVPVTAGLLLHKWLGFLTDKYKDLLKLFDQTIILVIVFTSFCESFAGDMFASYPISEIFVLAAGMLGLFLFIFGMMHLLSIAVKLNHEDRITLLFCGSKKSLVQGAVMGKVLFPNPLILGVVLLPLMLYHALQLVASSIIAESMSAKNKRL
ncbi:MAG: bile acid:sodium symporter family protein [Cytophaga sp.]|uniref:bile acid:sodium symporter family protein n=1 Tax=Cytophaga sp. TaxID=29535 RepID=UPI003F7F1E7A